MRKILLGVFIATLLLPLACFAEPYYDVYNSAWDIINQHYYSPSFNSEHWNDWETRYSEKISSKEDLELAINTMLGSLDDPYTFLTTPIETDLSKNIKNKKIGSQKDLTLNPPIENLVIPKNIRYVRIKSFSNRNTSMNFYKITKKSKKHEGYIIDLRWNGGGMVKMAAEIANMFLKDTMIVSTKDRQGNIQAYPANSITLPDTPIVVLVNNHTASASEILAAAFQDNKRAIIIGETTFGKGIVQEFKELPLGYGINYTQYQYLTPNGNFIHKKGVQPDIEINLTAEDFNNKKDPQLKKAIEILSTEIEKNKLGE